MVLSVMVFAMGIGSLAAKRLRPRAAAGFGAVEAALALIGGCSAMALYAVFAWTGDWGGVWTSGSRYLLAAFSSPSASSSAPKSPPHGADTAHPPPGPGRCGGGPLRGGLRRRPRRRPRLPLPPAPLLGQLEGALFAGTVNALAGGALVLGLFRGDLSRRGRWFLLHRQRLGPRPARRGRRPCRRLRTRGPARRLRQGRTGRPADRRPGGRAHRRHARPPARPLPRRTPAGQRPRRHRLHEALVHPAMNGPHARVLVLGGGDGLATREVLRDPGVRRVDVVELDPGVVRLARTDRPRSPSTRTRSATGASTCSPPTPSAGCAGPRRRTTWSSRTCPTPGITASTKLYSQEFYGLARRVLAPGGRLAVHAGPVSSRPRARTVESTLRAAGLRTTPYRVGGRDSSFAACHRTAGASSAPRDWGFILASATGTPLRLDPHGPRLRTLTQPSLTADAHAARRRSRRPPPVLICATPTETADGRSRIRGCGGAASWERSAHMEHEVFVPVQAERLREALADSVRVARAVPGLQQDAERSPVSGRLKSRRRPHHHLPGWSGSPRGTTVRTPSRATPPRRAAPHRETRPRADPHPLRRRHDRHRHLEPPPRTAAADLPHAVSATTGRLLNRFVENLAEAPETPPAAAEREPERETEQGRRQRRRSSGSRRPSRKRRSSPPRRRSPPSRRRNRPRPPRAV